MSVAEEWWALFAEWGKDVTGAPLPCTVETYEAAGYLGPTYAEPLSIPGLPQLHQKRLIRNAEGNGQTSQHAVYGPLEHRGRFPLHSRVTLADGAQVIVGGLSEHSVDGLMGYFRADLV